VIAFWMCEIALGLFTPATFLFRQTLNPADLNEAAAQKFFDGPTFDPILGWDANPTARNYEADRTYLAQSYGDSMTRGAEVGDDGTWQAWFAEMTGQHILNLGVNGYGVDQAVLKFEKYGARYPAKYVILSLNYQEYRRNPAHYSFYCFRTITFEHLFRYAFKPIFLPTGNDWELRLPPCRDANCLMEVLQDDSRQLRDFLSTHDRCYRLNQKRPLYRFPYTLNFLRGMAVAVRDISGSPEGQNYAFDNRESFELTKYLVARFTRTCEERGVQPVIMLIYSPQDLSEIARGKRLDARLLDFMRDRRIPFLDTGEFMAENRKANEELSAPMRHYNAAGNRLIAEALAQSGLLSDRGR
jgi:hypothetical protein